MHFLTTLCFNCANCLFSTSSSTRRSSSTLLIIKCLRARESRSDTRSSQWAALNDQSLIGAKLSICNQQSGSSSYQNSSFLTRSTPPLLFIVDRNYCLLQCDKVFAQAKFVSPLEKRRGIVYCNLSLWMPQYCISFSSWSCLSFIFSPC